jgi:cysteinyl-tRNA synthetase
MLSFYNTQTRKIEEFIPGGERKQSTNDYNPVKIYSCGPTVYGYAHIGNFRTFVFNDILRRYLKFRGYKVDHTMNITDVDDKTIRGANEKGITLNQYTQHYTEIFFKDLKLLNIEEVEHYPRATDSIESMNELIKKLTKKGLTYNKDGSTYFAISKYADYGKLSHIDSESIKTGTRYDTDEYTKDDVRDFALWKAVQNDEPGWQIECGYGRPGWHIECSAMIRKVYNSTIDIHTGGVDLIFPHHENEIAQSEAAYNEQFVRYWLHAEHLLVDNSKMSKSKGNFYTLHDLIEKDFSPRAIRFLLSTAHYRKQFNFTLENLKNASQPLSRIDNVIALSKNSKIEGPLSDYISDICESCISGFTEAMDSDLNVAKASASLFDLITRVNKYNSDNQLSKKDADLILETLRQIDSVFGFIFMEDTKVIDISEEEINKLIEERLTARQNKDYKRSDQIRDYLAENGIILEDSKDGTRWKKS